MNFKRFSTSDNQWHDIPHYIHTTSTDTITTLPAVLYPNGTTATVGLKGNMSQSGTPSTTTPIQPQECGERTGNLFDDFDIVGQVPSVTNGNLVNSAFGGTTSFIKMGSVEIVLSYNVSANIYLFLYDNDFQYIGFVQKTNAKPIYSTSMPNYSNAVYCRVRVDRVEDFSNTSVMLNTGSTALPYEPYGYKIPISSASTTTPVYLGEVETTRRINELVLTGEESWQLWNGNYYSSVIDKKGVINTIVCSHFINSSSNGISYNRNDSSGLKIAAAVVPFVTSVSELKTYLAAQYAAGTPVTVWYVLAEPTTGIVNEPLRKIGEYADTVSGISIPTTTGADSFDVLTTLKPSEVTVNYKGWHPVADVHEKSKNLFDYNAYFGSVFTPYNDFFNYSSIQLVSNTTYTLSTSIAEYGTNPRNTAFIVATTNQTPTTASGGISNISPITITTENDGILRLYKRISGSGILPTKDLFDAGDWLMLNTGSTALPYEPYWK